MASPPPPSGDTILFRPSKKRKIYRQRHDDDKPLPEPQAASLNTPTSPAPALPNPQSIDELIASTSATLPAEVEGEELEGTPVSISEILRLRKKNKRVGGVEFRAEGHIARDEDGELVIRHAAGEEPRPAAGDGGVIRKFARQTGAVGDVDKHMMAYIDSELAKRRVEGAQAQSSHPQSYGSLGNGMGGLEMQVGGNREGKKEVEVQRQPAALGKLLEIDLGDEARSKNVMRTEQARRRLDGEEIEDEDKPGKSGKPGKVRLGRDGKPWRGRKRRGSDDVKRDKLVEEVLRENRLEIYEEPVVESQVINDDQAADDRIAEAFRKEFMDAVSARQRKKTAPAPPPSRTVSGKKEEEVMKGPKLGGSRSARAAMRETMLKNAKK